MEETTEIKSGEPQEIGQENSQNYEKIARFLKLSIFAGILLIFSGIFFYIYYQIFIPIGNNPNEKRFTVNKGDGLNVIAKNLKDGGFIRNSLFFRLFVIQAGDSGNLQAGDYLLYDSMNVPQIAKKIAVGDAIPREKIITFPEGLRIEKMDEKLKEAGLLFSLSGLKAKDFKEKYGFLKYSSDGASLEGFLFPDTYKLYPEASAKDLAEKMLDNFDKKFTADLESEADKQGKSLYEIITMASVIEKEVKNPEDRRIVSGIFWKRIRSGMPLESCATIAYVLNDDKWRYSVQETKTPSLYNTYINRGLPPGPICSPGIESIKAAIYPEESPYLFFLTDPETGKTVFSKTLQEHNINKAKYLK